MQIFIVGMHRSGTSLVSRLLNLMGAYFAPEGQSIGFNEENLKGFWERKDVIEINQEILKNNFSDWNRISGFPKDSGWTEEIDDKLKKSLKNLVLNIDAFRPWFIKDPRLCLTLPAWKHYTEKPLVIYIFRDPLEVALSLKKRNNFPIEYGLDLWYHYNIHALRNTEELPSFYLNYNDLINNQAESSNSIFEWLKNNGCKRLDPISKDELESFIDKKLYRERKVEHNISIPEHYNWLFDHLLNGSKYSALSGEINLETERLSLFENRFIQFLPEGEVSRRMNNLMSENEKLTGNVQEMRSEISSRDQRIRTYDEENVEIRNSLSKLIDTKANLDQENLELKTQKSNLDQEILELKTQKANLDQENLELKTQKSSLDRENLELKTQNESLEDKIKELESINSKLVDDHLSLELKQKEELQLIRDKNSADERTISDLNNILDNSRAELKVYHRSKIALETIVKNWVALKVGKVDKLKNVFKSDIQNNILSEWGSTIEESKLFQENFYLSNNPEAFRDPVIHYLLVGGFQGKDPNPYFKSEWYLDTYPDVDESGLNPLLHYITCGGEEGRSTSPNFNSEVYVGNNTDVKEFGLTPLAHYLIHGLKEGRKIYPHVAEQEVEKGVGSNKKNMIKAPDLEVFEKIETGRNREAEVDIIIPVYKGYDDTINTIYCVLKSTCRTKYNLIIINDKSPDENLTEALRQLHSLHLFDYIENQKNLGFVKTVNLGMRLNEGRDVLLLNSDTEVYNNWLDRIRNQAYVHNADTVTPLSNNATICSYPDWPKDNIEPLELAYDRLDQLSEDINSGNFIEIPTGVGFCFYIKREALKRLGYFNEELFRKGYGEENDFCMRVNNSGGKNILALDVFVRHTGEVSFAEASDQEKNFGLKALQKLYPDYNQIIHDHIKDDPSKFYRQLLDLARISDPDKYKENVVYITHTWGGGIERYLKDKIDIEKQNNIGAFVVTPLADDQNSWEVNTINGIAAPNVKGFTFVDIEIWNKFKNIFNIKRVEIHSLAGWSSAVLKEIPEWCSGIGLDYSFMAHDYIPICPSAHLIDPNGNYCADLGDSDCSLCLEKVNYHGNIVDWRKSYHELLSGAYEVISPSLDCARRYERYFSGLNIKVNPHSEDLTPFNPKLGVDYVDGTTLRVGVIGAIGPHKGSKVLLDCAKYALTNGLDIKFVVIGFTNIPELNELPNVEVTGVYEENEVFNLIDSKSLHLAFIPSVWPETYCYTLSIAIKSGLPVAVFDIGAQSERVANKNSVKINFDQIDNQKIIIDQLLELINSKTN